MQTLTIPIPEGFEIDSLDKNTSQITLREKPKDVMLRINTLEDAIKELGEKDVEVIIYRKMEDFLSDQSHPVNQQKAIILTKAFNEGWVPDWDNTIQAKYFPWFEMGGSSGFRFDVFVLWRSASYVGSRLCFKSSKLAEHVGKKFTSVYKQFMLIK